MPLDEVEGNRVARVWANTGVRASFLLLIVAAAGCGPRVRPDLPDEDEPVVGPRKVGQTAAPPGRNVLIGEMCPEGAGGRPGVAPLLVRGVGWNDDPDDVTDQLERAARSFAVLGLDGKRAGIFEVLGVADVDLPSDVAIGSYAGRSPCAPASTEGGAAADAACLKATGGCGLAVASIDRGNQGEAGDVPELSVGGACLAGESLIVDIDGDGAAESFPIGQFIDSVRAPAVEVLAAPVVGVACDPAFALYGLVIVPPPEDDKAADDPRYHVTIDILGVADLDGDGRHEVAVSFRYASGRTLALYSAIAQAGRLELVGEAIPWQ